MKLKSIAIGLVLMLLCCIVAVGVVYQVYTPKVSKTAWVGGRRYTIESYMDPIYGSQKRVIGVEQPEVEGMVDPVGLASEIDAISRMQYASFTK